MRKLILALIAVSMSAAGAVASTPSMEVNPTTGMPFYTDDDTIGTWAIPSVDQLQLQGIMTGYPDGSFRPKANLTREEFAVALEKAMYALESRLQQAMYENNSYLYDEVVRLQLEVAELAAKQDVVTEVMSSHNWVGISIGATAVDDSDEVLVNLDGKYTFLKVKGFHVSVNPFVSTAGEGGAALMLNRDLGDKITVGAGAGAAIGWDDNGAITSEAGDVEGYGQLQVEYDLSDNGGVYVNGRVPFTGENDGDVTITGGYKMSF